MKNKKLFVMRSAIVLCSILLFSLYTSKIVFATEPEQFTLKVGYFNSYGVQEDANGNLSGYTCEYMEQIARINNWKITYVPCRWDEGLVLLQKGEIDTYGPLQKTPAREKLFDYPHIRMGYEYGALYAKNGNADIFYNDIQSIEGKTVGILKDNYYSEKFREFCQSQSITVHYELQEDDEALNSAFADGTIDMMVASSMQEMQDAKIVLSFSTDEFYYPTTKGNVRVLSGFNRALGIIQKDDIYYDAELYHKYYTQKGIINKAFTEKEEDYIKNAEPLKVTYEIKGEPLEYYDEETQTAKGISIDLLKEIGNHSGLQFEFVTVGSFEEAMEQTRNQEIDIVTGVAHNYQMEEISGLSLTDTLLNVELAFVLKQGYIPGKEATLALPKNWIGIRTQMEMNYPQLTIIEFPTMEDCLEAVLHEKADMTVQNTFAADKIFKSGKYQALSINNMSKGSFPICLGISKDADTRLVSILNKSIAAISADVRNQIMYTHTLGIPYEPSLLERIRYNSPALIAGVLLFFLVLFIMSRIARKKLNQLAFYDSLTGEMNLNKFKKEAEKVLLTKQKKYAVASIDIHRFKAINDLYGYDFGDKVLRNMAEKIRAAFDERVILCRATADKFNLCLPYEGDEWMKEQFTAFADTLEGIRYSDTTVCQVVVSCGVYVITPQDSNIISIIDRANIAAKMVKHSYVSSIAFYDQSMYDTINYAKKIENSMNLALKNNEFVVYLQPKVNLNTRMIEGAEALVRWKKADGTIVPPDEFIPLFEENGFIIDLDYCVFKQVCQMLERWKEEGRKMIPISVNLSRRHLSNQNTVQVLDKMAKDYRVDSKYLEMELTESAFVDCEIQKIHAMLDDLHGKGFSVSVDDFGSGYSSLSLLKDLPIDVLKIDKSFFNIKKEESDEKMKCLLESVITLSRKMNIKTVSEGVENLQQVELLTILGCDMVQGYYFAKPMPIEELEKKWLGG